MGRLKQGSFLIKTIIVIATITTVTFVYLLFSINEESNLVGLSKIFDNNIQLDNKVIFIDQNGKNFRSNNLKGHLSLIYFGVTTCPDDYIFLTRLSKIACILKKENILINLVFITLDPEHDTSLVIKQYLQQFEENFIGLTASSRDIKKIAQNFKVFYQKSAYEKTPGCEIEHSPFVYLMDSKGKFLKHYCLSLPSE